MTIQKQKLMEAEQIAAQLFGEIEKRQLIVPGKTESQLNNEVFQLAETVFGIKKHWHNRLVRSGANTLFPYYGNPPDLVIQEDDILFFDLGPIIEEWEADYGRTYVVGNDPLKLKLKHDVEAAWKEGKEWFGQQTALTGADFYSYVKELAHKYGWEYGGEIAGHLIGQFPHEKLESGNYGLYVHPGNPNDMFLPDANGNKREWILEIHFVDREREIGGFFEQLLT